MAIPNKDRFYRSCAWSLCGRFIATQTQEVVEVRDSFTFELLSSLQSTKLTSPLTGPLAYSPDGRSLCCASNTAIVIWDIQTGGVANEIKYDGGLDRLLVWSLDGGMICGIVRESDVWTAVTYCVVSGRTLSRGILSSVDKLYLWTYNKSFRVMTTIYHDKGCTIGIFEVWPTLTLIQKFNTGEQGDFQIGSFSPTFCCISISISSPQIPQKNGSLHILDLRRSNDLLYEIGSFDSHCFSSDETLFAASLKNNIHIWKRTPSCYTLWKKFPSQHWSSNSRCLQFSPTSLSILGHFRDILRVWDLGDRPFAFATDRKRHTIFSPRGTYIIDAHRQESTITITNLLSQSPPQFIDTDTTISGLALTGNILLVISSEKIVAWRLTEEGAVEGVFGKRRAGHGDSIWTISPMRGIISPEFVVRGQVGFITLNGVLTRAYHTGTGEGFECIPGPIQFPDFTDRWYNLEDTSRGRYHLHYHEPGLCDSPPEDTRPISRATLQKGWVDGPEGKYWLWLPVEWRMADVKWFYDAMTLQFEFPGGELIVVSSSWSPSSPPAERPCEWPTLMNGNREDIE